MRIFYFFNWEFSNLCHALSIKLSQDFPGMEFSGMVVGKKFHKMLKNQKEIKYKKLSYAYAPFKDYEWEEIDYAKLDEYEKEYGDPTLWNMLYSDRELLVFAKKDYTHEQLLKLLQRYIRETERILEEAKPEYVIFPGIASLPSRVLYAVAKKRGIKTLLFTATRTGTRTGIFDDPFVGFNKILADFDDYQSGSRQPKRMEEAKGFLASFRERGKKPGYILAGKKHIKENLTPIALLKRFPRAIDYLKRDLSNNTSYETFHTETLADKLAELGIKYKRRAEFDSKFFEKPNTKEKYVFFPLHLDPEMATMVRAPMYINQLATVENVAKSLPVAYKLYVKEHPMMAYLGSPRESTFYKDLKRIPNVRLISPRLEARPIISNCKMAIAITGTAGWEAAMLKKPVITLGDVFFNRLSTCHFCQDLQSLPNLISYVLKSHKHNERELLHMLSAIYENSFDGDYGYLMGRTGATYEEVLVHRDFPKLYGFLLGKLGL